MYKSRPFPNQSCFPVMSIIIFSTGLDDVLSMVIVKVPVYLRQNTKSEHMLFCVLLRLRK